MYTEYHTKNYSNNIFYLKREKEKSEITIKQLERKLKEAQRKHSKISKRLDTLV